MRTPLAASLAALLFLAATARAQGTPAAGNAPPPPPSRREPPAPSRWSLSGSIGLGRAYDADYLLVGARVGYALVHGLGVDLEGQYWAVGTPRLGKLAPGLTWTSSEGYYLGAYYARWLVSGGYPSRNAVGGRAGTTLASTGNVGMSVGVAYERVLDCATRCESFWPEAGVAVRF